MINPFRPTPAPLAFGKGKVVPEWKASLLSRVIFHWLSPFLRVGFSRPLQEDDLWELPSDHLTSHLTDKLEKNFYSRCPPEERPFHLREQLESGTRKTYDSSLPKALNATFTVTWWTAGVLQLLADTLKTTTPLLNRVILTWLVESYAWHRLSDEQRASGLLAEPRGIGYGVGLAIALFAMQEVSSLLLNLSMQLAMRVGLEVRTVIIGSVFRKSLRLSGRARAKHPVGQITTIISTDTTRFDGFAIVGHHLWVAPIQIIIGFALLIDMLGYSALVALAVLIVGTPFQGILVQVILKQRTKGVKFTDSRVKTTTEMLQGIRLLKSYGWEDFYLKRILSFRGGELRTVRKMGIALGLLIAMFGLLPTAGSVLSFITYALTGHDLNVAIIFASFQIFTIIQAPLSILPMVLAFFAEFTVASQRVTKVLTAEELEQPYTLDPTAKYDIEVDGDFTWENEEKVEEKQESPTEKAIRERAEKENEKKKKKENKKEVLPTTNVNPSEDPSPTLSETQPEEPFMLKDLSLKILPGQFVGIIGTVGSGKSSILQALIGEMRRTRGDVVLRRPVAYVPQNAWIRSATVRDNIVFGQAWDEARYHAVVKACCLEPDFETLSHGDLTEVGERGITLSGGQKARVSLARAAYSSSDIILLDDPLAAVDAHVGNALVEECLLSGPLKDRTRVLVTHALGVLSKLDYIYVVDGGHIVAEGTYDTLLQDHDAFSRLVEEFSRPDTLAAGKKTQVDGPASLSKQLIDTKGTPLMQAEERVTGAVTWDVYRKYFQFGGGLVWAPVIVILLALYQGCQVGNTLFLGFWTAGKIDGFRQGDYMAVYASFAVAQAFFAFLCTVVLILVGLVASFNMFEQALGHVLHSPMSFFDTTPLGRIHSRLSKDQDTVDNELHMYITQLMLTVTGIFGTVALVFYTFPLLGTAFVPLSIIYYIAAKYYRRTSVETKRLDSLLRSVLYSSYSETLTGLATIRAYREQERSLQHAENGLDLENRAYYMTISIQRWLAVRLDFLGNLLILGIALFAAGFRTSVNPADIGVVLSYSLSITQVFAITISQFAEVEQSMNAVERILVYTELPPQPAIASAKGPAVPPPNWPTDGAVSFKGVELRYRDGLPLVLKGVTFDIRAGEKVGVVGRTGAGKSSLLQALFRITELESGSITIDGYDIAQISINDLRHRIALVPQESVLFSGTMRDNLDPQGLRTDAELISLLQKTWLLPDKEKEDPSAENKFHLDALVGDEGSNFSVGEKQLIALCRALVKNSKIIILDEATSSVDVETDNKIQQTIRTEFTGSTLLCIAHRLNTIAYYDRVLVMDNGQVAEFDSVLNLYDKHEGSIFRSLCDDGNLTRADILRIRNMEEKT